MSMLSIFYAVLFNIAAVVLFAGIANKVRRYATTSAPLKYWRLVREVVYFESLFKSSKWTWIFGWTFHFTLFLVTLRHLRYFQEPVWLPVVLIQPFGTYAGFIMVAALGGLWARRWLVDRVRYISTPSDHMHLALLMLIGCSGLLMRFVAHTDIVAVKAFMLGLMRFDWQPLPSDPVLLLHLGLVAILMVIFPISKLLHAPGLFFSPTRNQWAAALDKRP